MNDKFIEWINEEIKDLDFQCRTGDMFPLGKHSEAVRIRAMYEQLNNEHESNTNDSL